MLPRPFFLRKRTSQFFMIVEVQTRRVLFANTFAQRTSFKTFKRFCFPSFFPLGCTLDLREDVCYGSVSSRGCEKPYGGRYKKVDCCCSVVGGGWGNPCQECPLENTGDVNSRVGKEQRGLNLPLPVTFNPGSSL